MKSLLLDPDAKSIAEIDFAGTPSEVAKLIGGAQIESSQIDSAELLLYDRDRWCDELFAGPCNRFDGPYLRIDHVQRHIHSRALLVRPRQLWKEIASSVGIWIPGRGLYRNLWRQV